MSLEPKDAHCMRAMDLFTQRRFDEAAAEFRKALEIDPSFTLALHGLARAQFEARDLDAAIETAKRIAELDPDDVTAYSTLSQCYVHKEDKEAAEHWGAKARMAGWKHQLRQDKKSPPGSQG